MYSDKKLVILDADGTTIDAFQAISSTFSQHDMSIGDLSRFQKRHNLFKYLGGVKEFPKNLKKQLKKVEREKLIGTLTEVYRMHGKLYPGMQQMIDRLLNAPDVVVGVVTRNITLEPTKTLDTLFKREQIDSSLFDFLIHIPLREKKTDTFRKLRAEYQVNPALSYVCGDEYKDYVSAIASGMSPLIASYGFENFERLTQKFDIPEEVISTSPDQLSEKLLHTLRL